MFCKLSLLILMLTLWGCEEVNPYSKVTAYDDLCQSIERYSASVYDRNVNWDSLSQAYRFRISEQLTESEYFEIIGELLRSFKDPHVWLIAPNQSMYTIDYLDYTQNIDKELLIQSYLEKVTVHTPSILSGFVSDSIGYLLLEDFNGDAGTNYSIYSEAMRRFQKTKGLIIDLRINNGGSLYNAQHLLNMLTSKKTVWHTTQNRTLHGFDSPYTWYIYPDRNLSYQHPVIVLTGRYTISAGERFVLGARQLHQVTVLGDTTANTQGSVMGREMLNGWQYTFTFEKLLDVDGINHAGIGISPDQYLSPTSTIVGSKDLAVERAVDLINGN